MDFKLTIDFGFGDSIEFSTDKFWKVALLNDFVTVVQAADENEEELVMEEDTEDLVYDDEGVAYWYDEEAEVWYYYDEESDDWFELEEEDGEGEEEEAAA